MERSSIPTHVGVIRPSLDRDISETNLGRSLVLKPSPAPVLSTWKTLRVTLIHSYECPAVELGQPELLILRGMGLLRCRSLIPTAGC